MKAIEGKFDTRLSAWRQYGKNGNNTGKTYDTLTRARKAKEIDHAFIKGVYYVNKAEAEAYLEEIDRNARISACEPDECDSERVDVTRLFASFLEYMQKNGGVR